VGEADGMTIDEFTRVYGGFNDADPDHPISPGGESPRMLETRVRRATDALPVRFPDQTVMLFTHGGFVRTATTLALGASIIAPEWLISQPRNTSLTTLTHNGAWIVDRYNDAAHLSAG
jgi:probable phosphoglycerate mutase